MQIEWRFGEKLTIKAVFHPKNLMANPCVDVLENVPTAYCEQGVLVQDFCAVFQYHSYILKFLHMKI